MMKMLKEMHEAFDGNRLGISYLELKDFSIGRDLERAINSIQSEIDKTPAGVGRRIVQSFEHFEKKRELHLSTIVEIPIKIRELVVDKGKIGTQEKIDYYSRNVRAIIRMGKNYIIIFAQNQHEVKEFAKYLRELTMAKFNPVSIKLNPENMQKMIDNFETIHQLKILLYPRESIKFIRFSGMNLIDSPIVKEIISNKNNEIIEIAGVKSISHDNQVKLHVNNKGRLWIYTNPENIDSDDIYNLMRDFEKISLDEE